jgi:hypothetical protein
VKRGRSIAYLLLGSLLLVGLSGSAKAADAKSTDKSKSSSVTGTSTLPTDGNSNSSGLQGYMSDTVMQIGTVVQLAGDKKTSSKVESATSKDLTLMYGAVIDPHKLSFTISDASIPNETYVATSGTYDVLVNTENGTIKTGDYVTLSALNGVAMKADYRQKEVFGRAAGAFDGKANAIGTATLKSSSGSRTQTVAIGLIPVAINIQKNPIEKSTKANLPQKLQKFGQAIADKPISPVKIFLSIAITGASLIIAITILYSGVRNAIISIGRNPLSRKSIIRGLVSVVLVGFIVVVIGLFAVYLLLKL